MSDDPFRLCDSEILTRLLTRRDLARVGVASALLAAPLLLIDRHNVVAQSAAGTATTEEGAIYRPATPVGTPQPQASGEATTVGPPPGETVHVPGVEMDAFMDLSLALVGGGTLDASRGDQLLALIATNPNGPMALEELLSIRAGGAAATSIATPVATLSGDARGLVEQILRFWYLGTWDGQPVNDRAGFWFGLSAWQAVKYTYAPSVCRAFGIWATPPPTQ